MSPSQETPRWVLVAVLLAMGASWAVTIPLAKIAVSEGYRHLGIIFWQLVLGALFLGGLNLMRGKGLPVTRPQLLFYVVIAMVGTILPNMASYQSAIYLPAGILSIVIALVPMFAFPLALAMGTDQFSWAKLAGLCFGLIGVLLLVGPEASLPERWMVWVIPLAMLGPIFYAFEANLVAKWGTFKLDAIQVPFGASVVGALLTGPVALASGHFINPLPPYGNPDFAVMGIAVLHAGPYAAYVWLVSRAGAVFAAQVAYLVTGFGVLWSMLLLGERYAGTVWLALGVMFLGLFLVQPRREAPVVPKAAMGDDQTV